MSDTHSSQSQGGSAHGTEAATAEVSARQRYRPWLPADVFRGAVLGDYARLGMAGYVTQAAFGFIPAVGTACALRDLTADLRRRDRLGATLNGLSLIPFLGGFPKVARVVRSVRNTGNAVQLSGHLYDAYKA